MLNCTTFSYATMWNDGIKCWERKQVNISGNVGKYDLFAVCCYQRDGRLIGATIKQSTWFLFLSGIYISTSCFFPICTGISTLVII